ncbi:MAG: DUF4349 domain-containing protein [Actinomycetota bacterium]
MRRYVWPVVLVLAVAAIVGFVALRPSGQDVSVVAEDGSGGGGSVSVGIGAEPMPLPATGADVKAGDASFALGAANLPQGPSIIKYGDIAVVIDVGDFDAALDRATGVAARYGGFVLGSSVSGGERRSGYLTIRVNATDFDRAMADLRAIGDVERESVSGQDVSMQLVDLEARLVSWKAQREVLLRLMDASRTVADTLKVQVELQNVQMNIEQIEGELTYLGDQVDLATISVAIREPGADEGIDDRPRIGDAWSLAVEAFLKVIVAMIVGLGYVVPIGVVLGALGWGARRPDPPDRTLPDARTGPPG